MMFRKPWFWYSVLAVLAWGAWAVLSKLAASEIPAESLQFLFTVGTLPVAVALLVERKLKVDGKKAKSDPSWSVSNRVV